MKKKKVLQEEQVTPPAEPAEAPEESHEGLPSGRRKQLVAAMIGGASLLFGIPLVLRLFTLAPQVHVDKAAHSSAHPQPAPSFKASTWSSDFKVMLQYAELYDELHPFIYSLKGRQHNPPEIASAWGHKQKLERVAALRAKNPRVRIIPTIFRWENPGEKINEVIGMNGRDDIRDRHIQAIIQEVEKYGYDGIDIDYEGMSCNKKEKFEEFIAKLSHELHKRNKLLSVAVHPKTPVDSGDVEEEEDDTVDEEEAPPASKISITDAAAKSVVKTSLKYANKNLKHAAARRPLKQKICAGLKRPITLDFRENWRGPLTHDYAFLGKHADMVKIMAYELHPRKYRNPGPGPQAPGTWLEEIIEYARDKIPAEKLYMAIPTYGYDWGLNCRAPIKAVYYSDVVRIKAGAHKHIQPTDIGKILDTTEGSAAWRNLTRFRDIHEDKVYEDPSLWYRSGGCTRVAFYMDRTAFAAKMSLLQKSRLAGFSFWQLTQDNDPEIQKYLSTILARATN
jgi:spore germination protein YaaH